MKSLFLMAASVALISAVTASAASAADDTSWYVRGDAGASFSGRIDGKNGPRSDSGGAVDAGVGKSLGNGWRADAQLFYLSGSGKSGFGDTKVTGALLNGYYDFLPDSAWRPFLGAGIGAAEVKVEHDGTAPHGDKSVFAYQIHAGISHAFTDQLTGELAYHYLGAPSVEFDSGAKHVDGDFSASLVTVGLRYRLGG
jgi:OOP family OmpA-OmpF porin